MTQEHPETVQLVFKHRPWDFHSQSEKAHLAAEEAHAQGHFWAYALAMLDGFAELDEAQLENLASGVGMDKLKLRQALQAETGATHVALDRDQAEALGINATPTLFLNGRRIVGDEPLEFWRKEIALELERRKVAPAPAATPSSAAQSPEDQPQQQRP